MSNTANHSTLAYTPNDDPGEAEESVRQEVCCLTIVWAAHELARVGQVGLPREEGEACWLGAVGTPMDGEETPGPLAAEGAELLFFAQRPLGASLKVDPPRPLQLTTSVKVLIHAEASQLHLVNQGTCPVYLNGQLVREAVCGPGDLLLIKDLYLFYCVRRPRQIFRLRNYPKERMGAFGRMDADGLIGESLAMWHLREQIAASAKTNFHTLILGASGVGKELVAQAIHKISRRASQQMVSENFASIPDTLAAAILFGNKRNFPNPGMEDRKGLVGTAHHSTLFLDEIGDAPDHVQALLLRVTEHRGEYMRLGDDRKYVSDFRLIAATNRPEGMRPELVRRFLRQIIVPGIEQRREDIPLLARNIVLEYAEQEGGQGARRFIHDGEPVLSRALIEQLLRHRYSTHVSEVVFLVLRAVDESRGTVVEPLRSIPPSLAELYPLLCSSSGGSGMSAPRARVQRNLPSPNEAQQQLNNCCGDVSAAARHLEISRDQLNRMIRNHNLTVSRIRKGQHRKVPEPYRDDLASGTRSPRLAVSDTTEREQVKGRPV